MSEAQGYKAAVRAWAAAHHVPQPAIDRWIAMDQTDAMAILSAAQDLRLRTGQLLAALEMLTEIAVREGQGPARILAREELRPLLRGAASRPQRASALLEKLRALRYPRLAQSRAQLEAAAAALRLPAAIAVVLPRDLSSDELTIRLTVRSAAELDRTLAALAQRREQLKAMIGMLGGADEI